MEGEERRGEASSWFGEASEVHRGRRELARLSEGSGKRIKWRGQSKEARELSVLSSTGEDTRPWGTLEASQCWEGLGPVKGDALVP